MTAPAQRSVTLAQAIGALRREGREREACAVLHDFFQRTRFLMAGTEQAPILLLYGLGNLSRGEVIFHNPPEGPLSFSANGGHFDSTQLLRFGGMPADRLFLDSKIDDRTLAELRERASAYQVVVNTIADPTTEPDALHVAQRLCDGLSRRVLNAPAQVMETTRDGVAARLDGIDGLCVPRVASVAPGDSRRAELLDRLAKHPAGLILRPQTSQTGIGVALVHDPAAIDAWLALHADAMYATDFHDFRGADGLYRKFRVFAIGGQLWPEHMITAPHWNIHTGDRRTAMQDDDAMRRAEQDFLAAPQAFVGEKAWATLQAIAQRMRLDYFGIDFALLPGGGVLLFEANPAMRLNYDPSDRFPYLRPHLEAVSHAFAAMVKRGLDG